VTTILGAVLGFGIALVALAARRPPQRTTAPAAVPIPAAPVPAAYVACHTTTCGHLSRPHDHTAAGLTCRTCGHVTEATDA
jgi:hypothetical protein